MGEASTVSGELDGGRSWLSVREAAGYLGVSEPTIFRWMKDGLLSFYKIGNATRFSRDGLDSVIRKNTGTAEAEAVASRCAACGHAILVDGRMQGAGKLYFRPDRSRFWILEESLVPIRARVCPVCGHVQIHADADKLRRLLPGPDDNAKSAESAKGAESVESAESAERVERTESGENE